MTRRYYYTEPLAAAWMAKYFGIKICNNYTVENKECDASKVENDYEHFESNTDYFIDHEAILLLEMYADKNNEYHFYIHSDSECLLEPQVGDIYCVNNNRYRTILPDQKEPLNAWHDTLFSAKALSKTQGLDFRIIYRNNIPFIWPELKDE